jgi:hypothetical protein
LGTWKMRIMLRVFGDVNWITGRHSYEWFKGSLVIETVCRNWLDYLISCLEQIVEVCYQVIKCYIMQYVLQDRASREY